MVLRLKEDQFRRLFENDGDSIFLDGEDTTKKLGSEVTTQSMISKPDGDDEMSKPVGDRIGKQLTPQNWGISHGAGRRFTSAL